ncbi:flagellar biosynthesis regulator FlaF [Microvirga makkahensis]|uniref:Flagellar biosynthesis regulator FlaF n=1 Tax=Microvirga makkahensis TaxID=1128670 RepID=A0A7X3MR55_9HYPH|nr:flagellar biosynthesis regulator FlaF [Microvirga makkahensis]MXQ11677.1 flagellar biosynthesis regulator FlaF [Microvirga makkahensis]
MYQFSYSEILEDSPKDCRQREYDLFERAITLLRAAEGHPSQSPEMLGAIVFLQRLWTFLMKDLSHPDNSLPDKLKGQLISIGLWMMRETDLIVRGEHNNVAALIDINILIKDGLK